MQNVTMIDMTAMVALKSIINNFQNKNKILILSGLNNRIERKLEKANFDLNKKGLASVTKLEDAILYAKSV